MDFLIVGAHYCFMRFAYALHMRRQNLALFICLYIKPFELVIEITVGVGAACMLAYTCLQKKWWAAVMVVAIPSQRAMLICPYVSFSKFSELAPHCSRALLHSLQLHLIAV